MHMIRERQNCAPTRAVLMQTLKDTAQLSDMLLRQLQFPTEDGVLPLAAVLVLRHQQFQKLGLMLSGIVSNFIINSRSHLPSEGRCG